MGRIFGILAIVLGIWIGLEMYSKGLDGAFGGAFGGASSGPEAPRADATTAQRAGSAVDDSYREMEGRYESQLGE